MKDFVLSYRIGDKLYLNVTNRCTCRCAFCIRETRGGVGYNLWLEKEPTAQEVIFSLGDLSLYQEVVFCGYGEPMIRLELVKEVALHLKKQANLPVRINTNGHADLIHGPGSVHSLRGLVDRISISLNAHSGESYTDICRPVFGVRSYEAILRFTQSCIGVIPEITWSVVEWPGVDVVQCQEMAKRLGVNFRLRKP